MPERHPANIHRLTRAARKRRRHKPKARSTSLEKIREAILEKQAVHVSDVSVFHSAGKEKPIITVSKHRLSVECGPAKVPDVETVTTNAVVSPRQAKENLREPTEDCAMPDDYTEPAVPQTQDKECQPHTEKPDLRTVTPVTKIGSSFEELRNYKIPKIKHRVPPTKEHGSRISRTYPVSPVSKKRREKQDEHREELSSSSSSSPAVSTSSSNVLLDKIIEDMNKAYPKVSGCYVSCRDSCPLRNQVDEFPKSPVKCPPEDNQRLSKSAILDCAPVSSHIGRKQQVKVCTVCKRKDVSEGLGQDTCIRCSLYKQINKEQAAMKQHGSKERQAVREPDVPAKAQARRSSSDVENKELVTRTPTSPRSKSWTSNRDNVNTASPQANEHKNVVRKRRRKTYLTKQIISSSDDSCTSEDGTCAAAASAVPAPQDGASSLQSRQPRPQRKCRALCESPQNATEEPARKDNSQDSEKPLATGPKDSKAKSKFRRVQGIKAKPKCRKMQGKGSKDEKLRRKVMREAWKNAKDTDDYLRALGEMEKSIKATKTLQTQPKIAKKSEELEKLGSINDGHTDAKSVPEEHEQQFESVKGHHTDADPTVEGDEQLESVKCEHPDANPDVAEHEELQNAKCEHADAKPASEEQCGEVDIDIGGLASDILVSANSPALVVASCCSLSLTDWEGMQNESMDGVNSEVVGGEVNKVASAYTLPSDGALPNSHASTSPKKCAGKAVLPSAVVIDLSDDRLNWKRIEAVMKCPMGLPYLLSFEDDGAMSVTIRDGVSGGGGGGGREKGFSAKESGELVQEPQEVRPPSSSDADNMTAPAASVQEGGFTLKPGEVVGKSHLDGTVALTDTDTGKGGAKILAGKPGSSKQEEPAAFSASSALPPSPCSKSSSHISVDTSAASEQGAVHCDFNAHAVDRADTVCSSNKDSSPVIPAECGAPLTQPSLCATEDVTEAHVNISYAAQGASCSGSVASLGVPALSIGQLMLSEAANIKSLGMDGTVNGSLPSSIDPASPANQAVSAAPMNMNTDNMKSSCTAKHDVEKGCLPNTGITPSGTDYSLLLAMESMEMTCRRHFTAKDNVRSSCLKHDEHHASRMAQSQLHSSHMHSSRVHSTHANSHRSRNVLPRRSRDSRHTARSVWPLDGNVGTSDSPACFDTVCLVETVFGISKAPIGTIDRGCADQGGMLHQMLEEYVHYIERFLAALHECTPGYRDRLVGTLLPDGIVGLKRIVQLLWRMEAELQCLGRDRVSDIDKGIFSLLMEHTGNLSKTTAEQDLPTFMSFQERIEPQLPTLADPPCQEAADDGQHANCCEVLEHHTELNGAANVASEAVGQLGGAEASTVSVASVDRAVAKTVDAAEVLIIDDPDEEGRMVDVPAASCQRAITGVQTNRMQGLGSVTALRQPSDTVSEKSEMAGQLKSPQATTVDVAVQGTAQKTTTVHASPLDQGQQSTGVSCPPHAATGTVQNRSLHEASLTVKPKNLDAVSSAKVSQRANAKDATREQTDAAVAVAATSINSSDSHRIPSTVKAAQPRQQRWDQGPKPAHTASQNSVLSTGMELDPTMLNRQQPDRSVLRSLLNWQRATLTGFESVGDTCSTAQQSSQTPKKNVAKVSSQQGISQGIPSNQNSRQGQQAHSAAGRPPQQVRQLRYQLRDPPPLMYAGPQQHTVQNEGACTQQSIMNSRQREELAKQLAWLNAYGFPGNLQGSSGPPYSSARQFCMAPGCIRTGQPCNHASRPVHAQGYASQPEPRTQLQERDLRLQQQHVQGQQYATNTDASNPLPALSESYGSQINPMDAALIQAESEVLNQLKIQQYLNLLMHRLEAGRAAPAPGQQPGRYKASEQKQLSEREKRLQQQINDALNAFTKGAAQNAQQWYLRACQSFQQPLQYPTVEHSSESSAQPRADINSSTRISEESVSLESPARFVRPWTDKSQWPEPYAACQDALQRWKNRQLQGEPKTKVPRDAVEQIVDEYRAASNVRPQQTMEAQDHVFMHQVCLPEQNRNMAQSDISDHALVRHTAVPRQNPSIVARYDVSGQAPARQEVSVPQQSRNFVAWPGFSGGTCTERSTSTWRPPNAIPQLSADIEVSSGHLAKNRAASSTRLPSQQISREGFVFQPVPGQPSNSVQGTLPQ